MEIGRESTGQIISIEALLELIETLPLAVEAVVDVAAGRLLLPQRLLGQTQGVTAPLLQQRRLLHPVLRLTPLLLRRSQLLLLP